MPFSQDVLTRIFNVHWGGDLAVEFFDPDSFLNLPTGPASDSTKATISIWFRIPKAAFEAAISRSASVDEITQGAPSAYFWGAVPVVSFGPTDITSSSGAQTSSSWIGACWNPGDGGGSDFGLAFNFQYESTGNIAGGDDLSNGFPERIAVGITWNGLTSIFSPPIIPVSADTWHHLLMSWNTSSPISSHPAGAGEDPALGIDSAVTIHAALDDVNITGGDAFGIYGGYLDGNGFITENAYNVATSDQLDPVTFDWVPTPLPMSPFGLPTAGLVEFNPHVMLAEFQFFTGVAIDTSNAANRRAFIDKDGNPVDPAEAETLLGQKPVILLHGSGNWKAGHNTGSGVDLAASGHIDTYHPNPSLG